MAYKILLIGGGTSGHVFPLVAVAEELKNKTEQSGAKVEICFLGDGKLIEQVSLEFGAKSYSILSAKWRRYFDLKNILDLFKMPVALIQSVFWMWMVMPDVVFSKGGYTSIFPVLAAKLFFIPVYLHESDAIPGSANRFLAGFSRKIFVSMEVAAKYFNQNKVEVTGNPIRKNILSAINYERDSAVASFGLDHSKPVLFITGASQGAKSLNDVLLLSLTGLSKKIQIIHQCGEKNYKEVNSSVQKILEEGKDSYSEDIKNNYRLYPTLNAEQMALAYAAADIVLSRAGSSIHEISAVGKTVILIPIKKSANNHQLANAREMAKFGAVVIEEDNLTPHILTNEIMEAYGKRVELSEKIKQFAKLGASEKIVESILVG